MSRSSTPMFIFSAARRYFSLQSKYMLEELCILVDESDHVLGFADKKGCHEVLGGKSLLHRAFSLFLFREDTNASNSDRSLKLLVQKRSANKLTFPSLWSNTCCSHPIRNFPDEMVELDAFGVKRLPSGRINFLGRVLYAAPNEPFTENKFAENEVDYILVSVLDPAMTHNLLDTDIIKINPDEVSEVRWMSLDDFENVERYSLSNMNLPKTSESSFCKSNITPWLRGLLTSGLLRKIWSWAEASCRDQLQNGFVLEDNSWIETESYIYLLKMYSNVYHLVYCRNLISI
ncbi:unnamed protein product [Heterobilharzia americana]|nr:unnamed protein product [Heterobilharzia americana]